VLRTSDGKPAADGDSTQLNLLTARFTSRRLHFRSAATSVC
jgi:hypothetical protein